LLTNWRFLLLEIRILPSHCLRSINLLGEGMFPYNSNLKDCTRERAAVALSLLLLAASQNTLAQSAQAPASPNPSQSVTLPSFVNLVKQQGNAVVHISVTQTISQTAGLPFDENDPMYEFFRRFLPPPEQGTERQAQGMGSGFIINQDGHILTNSHVVANADEVNVRLTDKREFKAKVLGVDPLSDVALIKIDATQLPTVRIGNPNNLLAGEWVAAIGAPFGFENSVTAGIVSATGRSFPGENYVPFIQTDVAVNPGNSGGPLFNMQGEVVGINSMIYSRTGGYMGLSFAIPSDLAMDVATQLRQTGKVTRSRIGVQAQELTRELASSFGLTEPRGALVSMVEKGAPAERAGLMPSDIILGINGQPVEGSADLARLVAGSKPGSAITLDVWRKGKRMPIQVTTMELKLPDEQPARAEAGPQSAASAGLVVSPIPEQQRQAMKLDHGVLVHRAAGPAAKAGIAPGDLILRVNDTPIKSVQQLQSIARQNAGKTIAVLLRRGQNTLFIPLPLPSATDKGG
jgi:serine protease Do